MHTAKRSAHIHTNGIAGTYQMSIANPNNRFPSGLVYVSGTAKQGQTLSATNTLADADGLGTISYQWLADGMAIDDAVGSTFTLTQAQVGKAVTVQASYTDLLGTTESMASSPRAKVSNVNDAPTGGVSISGTPAQGQKLAVAHTLADADGLGTIKYQWLADGAAIKGATGSTLTLTQAQVGKAISVRASYTDQFGTAESVSSVVTAQVSNVNDAPTGGVTISGTATQGQKLKATNTMDDADGLGAVTYQWLADGTVINGATGAILTLTQAQVGKAISVRASYTDKFGAAESLSSVVTPKVSNANDAPTGSVTISGTAIEGHQLTAVNTVDDVDGLGAITYQWMAGGVAISGATGSTLTLTQAQVGKTISVRASYTDQFGTAERVSSVATAKVSNVNDAPTGSVTISGTATEGQKLKATNTLADADGLGTITYQWLADGAVITGATGSTLTLTQAQVGKTISVRASYTDLWKTKESVTSAASDMVTSASYTGTNGADVLGGSTGDDLLIGCAGNDTLHGGQGNDFLVGGAGKDRLIGGADRDVFVFSSLADLGLGASKRDVILDFNSSEGDKVYLSLIDADPRTAGQQKFRWVNTFSTTAGEMRFSDGMLYLNTDNDTAAEYEIELTGVGTLTDEDFVLGSGGGKSVPPYVLPPISAPQSNFQHLITKPNDIGEKLANFGPDQTGATYSIARVVNNANNANVTSTKATSGTAGVTGAQALTDPDIWFYLDTRDGQVYLTKAGAESQNVGESYTLTVRATSGTQSVEASMSFTLTSLGLTPNPATPVLNPVDKAGDIGLLLADFGPVTGLESGYTYSVVRVVDEKTGLAVTGMAAAGFGAYNPAQYLNPATDPWFYLNQNTGEVVLTNAGANAACIGKSYTVEVQASSSAGLSEVASVNFTVGAPTTGHVYDFYSGGAVANPIDNANSGFDVLQVHQGNSDLKQMQVLPNAHGLLEQPSSLYVQVGDNLVQVSGHFLPGPNTSGAVEFLTFVDSGNYYGYELGTMDALEYYRVQLTESTNSNKIINGTACNDLLFGHLSSDGHDEVFNGGDGNDLIFADALFTGSPSNWTALTNGLADVLNGGNGNDLLVGGGGVDQLNGGAGNDWLIGGFGKDNLTGGAGADKFVFNASRNAADADTITDFSLGEGDQILLDKLVFSDANALDLVSYNASTGGLSYDGTTIATLTGGMDYSAVLNSTLIV